LIQNDFMYFSHLSFNDLIPFESNDPNERKNKKRIIIGHNVGYDRSYIKEQYYLEVRVYDMNFFKIFFGKLILKRSGLRFLDTMSMHIACFGLTSEQRSLLLNTNSDNGMISKVVKNSNEYGNGKFVRSKKSVK
jgi:DNA polymerase gamma 1